MLGAVAPGIAATIGHPKHEHGSIGDLALLRSVLVRRQRAQPCALRGWCQDGEGRRMGVEPTWEARHPPQRF